MEYNSLNFISMNIQVEIVNKYCGITLTLPCSTKIIANNNGNVMGLKCVLSDSVGAPVGCKLGCVVG